ncbi:MAG: DUF3048 domain-containing protein [Candidatus Aenigmarchaeota archaeon]|nr:DUF3048 domain-containing protein [Candidatus Aenigmarchaeota archaeon]
MPKRYFIDAVFHQQKGQNKNLLNQKLLVVAIIIFLLIVFTISYCLFGFNSKDDGDVINSKTSEQQNKTKTPLIFSALNGVFLNKQDKELLPVAVLIDNIIDAWPPSGINQASIIYEVPVEAGITRLIAIFSQTNLPQKIGPVRSARPYLAHLVGEYGALFVHAGGSFQVLQELKQGDHQVYNVDALTSDGRYFWRGVDKKAPHNLFISKDNLQQIITKRQLPTEANFSSWLWQDEPSIEKRPIISSEIIINFSNSSYQVKWRYQRETNHYLRWQKNLAYLDDQRKQIETSNIIIQYVPVSIIDSVGRRKIDLTGQGKTIVFRDGRTIIGQWKKENNRTRFFDENDKEIAFNSGQIWIEIVPEETDVIY